MIAIDAELCSIILFFSDDTIASLVILLVRTTSLSIYTDNAFSESLLEVEKISAKNFSLSHLKGHIMYVFISFDINLNFNLKLLLQ